MKNGPDRVRTCDHLNGRVTSSPLVQVVICNSIDIKCLVYNIAKNLYLIAIAKIYLFAVYDLIWGWLDAAVFAVTLGLHEVRTTASPTYDA